MPEYTSTLIVFKLLPLVVILQLIRPLVAFTDTYTQSCSTNKDAIYSTFEVFSFTKSWEPIDSCGLFSDTSCYVHVAHLSKHYSGYNEKTETWSVQFSIVDYDVFAGELRQTQKLYLCCHYDIRSPNRGYRTLETANKIKKLSSNIPTRQKCTIIFTPPKYPFVKYITKLPHAFNDTDLFWFCIILSLIAICTVFVLLYYAIILTSIYLKLNFRETQLMIFPISLPFRMKSVLRILLDAILLLIPSLIAMIACLFLCSEFLSKFADEHVKVLFILAFPCFGMLVLIRRTFILSFARLLYYTFVRYKVIIVLSERRWWKSILFYIVSLFYIGAIVSCYTLILNQELHKASEFNTSTEAETSIYTQANLKILLRAVLYLSTPIVIIDALIRSYRLGFFFGSHIEPYEHPLENKKFQEDCICIPETLLITFCRILYKEKLLYRYPLTNVLGILNQYVQSGHDYVLLLSIIGQSKFQRLLKASPEQIRKVYREHSEDIKRLSLLWKERFSISYADEINAKIQKHLVSLDSFVPLFKTFTVSDTKWILALVSDAPYWDSHLSGYLQRLYRCLSLYLLISVFILLVCGSTFLTIYAIVGHKTILPSIPKITPSFGKIIINRDITTSEHNIVNWMIPESISHTSLQVYRNSKTTNYINLFDPRDYSKSFFSWHKICDINNPEVCRTTPEPNYIVRDDVHKEILYRNIRLATKISKENIAEASEIKDTEAHDKSRASSQDVSTRIAVAMPPKAVDKISRFYMKAQGARSVLYEVIILRTRHYIGNIKLIFFPESDTNEYKFAVNTWKNLEENYRQSSYHAPSRYLSMKQIPFSLNIGVINEILGFDLPPPNTKCPESRNFMNMITLYNHENTEIVEYMKNIQVKFNFEFAGKTFYGEMDGDSCLLIKGDLGFLKQGVEKEQNLYTMDFEYSVLYLNHVIYTEAQQAALRFGSLLLSDLKLNVNNFKFFPSKSKYRIYSGEKHFKLTPVIIANLEIGEWSTVFRLPTGLKIQTSCEKLNDITISCADVLDDDSNYLSVFIPEDFYIHQFVIQIQIVRRRPGVFWEYTLSKEVSSYSLHFWLFTSNPNEHFQSSFKVKALTRTHRSVSAFVIKTGSHNVIYETSELLSNLVLLKSFYNLSKDYLYEDYMYITKCTGHEQNMFLSSANDLNIFFSPDYRSALNFFGDSSIRNTGSNIKEASSFKCNCEYEGNDEYFNRLKQILNSYYYLSPRTTKMIEKVLNNDHNLYIEKELSPLRMKNKAFLSTTHSYYHCNLYNFCYDFNNCYNRTKDLSIELLCDDCVGEYIVSLYRIHDNLHFRGLVLFKDNLKIYHRFGSDFDFILYKSIKTILFFRFNNPYSIYGDVTLMFQPIKRNDLLRKLVKYRFGRGGIPTSLAFDTNTIEYPIMWTIYHGKIPLFRLILENSVNDELLFKPYPCLLHQHYVLISPLFYLIASASPNAYFKTLKNLVNDVNFIKALHSSYRIVSEYGDSFRATPLVFSAFEYWQNSLHLERTEFIFFSLLKIVSPGQSLNKCGSFLNIFDINNKCIFLNYRFIKITNRNPLKEIIHYPLHLIKQSIRRLVLPFSFLSEIYTDLLTYWIKRIRIRQVLILSSRFWKNKDMSVINEYKSAYHESDIGDILVKYPELPLNNIVSFDQITKISQEIKEHLSTNILNLNGFNILHFLSISGDVELLKEYIVKYNFEGLFPGISTTQRGYLRGHMRGHLINKEFAGFFLSIGYYSSLTVYEVGLLYSRHRALLFPKRQIISNKYKDPHLMSRQYLSRLGDIKTNKKLNGINLMALCQSRHTNHHCLHLGTFYFPPTVLSISPVKTQRNLQKEYVIKELNENIDLIPVEFCNHHKIYECIYSSPSWAVIKTKDLIISRIDMYICQGGYGGDQCVNIPNTMDLLEKPNMFGITSDWHDRFRENFFFQNNLLFYNSYGISLSRHELPVDLICRNTDLIGCRFVQLTKYAVLYLQFNTFSMLEDNAIRFSTLCPEKFEQVEASSSQYIMESLKDSHHVPFGSSFSYRNALTAHNSILSGSCRQASLSFMEEEYRATHITINQIVEADLFESPRCVLYILQSRTVSLNIYTILVINTSYVYSNHILSLDQVSKLTRQDSTPHFHLNEMYLSLAMICERKTSVGVP